MANEIRFDISGMNDTMTEFTKKARLCLDVFLTKEGILQNRPMIKKINLDIDEPIYGFIQYKTGNSNDLIAITSTKLYRGRRVNDAPFPDCFQWETINVAQGALLIRKSIFSYTNFLNKLYIVGLTPNNLLEISQHSARLLPFEPHHVYGHALCPYVVRAMFGRLFFTAIAGNNNLIVWTHPYSIKPETTTVEIGSHYWARVGENTKCVDLVYQDGRVYLFKEDGVYLLTGLEKGYLLSAVKVSDVGTKYMVSQHNNRSVFFSTSGDLQMFTNKLSSLSKGVLDNFFEKVPQTSMLENSEIQLDFQDQQNTTTDNQGYCLEKYPIDDVYTGDYVQPYVQKRECGVPHINSPYVSYSHILKFEPTNESFIFKKIKIPTQWGNSFNRVLKVQAKLYDAERELATSGDFPITGGPNDWCVMEFEFDRHFNRNDINCLRLLTDYEIGMRIPLFILERHHNHPVYLQAWSPCHKQHINLDGTLRPFLIFSDCQRYFNTGYVRFNKRIKGMTIEFIQVDAYIPKESDLTCLYTIENLFMNSFDCKLGSHAIVQEVSDERELAVRFIFCSHTLGATPRLYGFKVFVSSLEQKYPPQILQTDDYLFMLCKRDGKNFIVVYNFDMSSFVLWKLWEYEEDNLTLNKYDDYFIIPINEPGKCLVFNPYEEDRCWTWDMLTFKPLVLSKVERTLEWSREHQVIVFSPLPYSPLNWFIGSPFDWDYNNPLAITQQLNNSTKRWLTGRGLETEYEWQYFNDCKFYIKKLKPAHYPDLGFLTKDFQVGFYSLEPCIFKILPIVSITSLQG